MKKELIKEKRMRQCVETQLSVTEQNVRINISI